MTQAVAGPTAARLLADFGAEVIKVGSPVPTVTDGIVGHLHRGKRTLLMDVKSSDGQALLGRLMEGSDVFITNFTASSATRYNIDYERACTRNPDVVYCVVSAYGTAGPWAARRGYQNQCNAATGMSSRYGSRFGWTLYQPSPINDTATGILATIAIGVGLFARLRGGAGQKVGASLAQASTLHQAVSLVAEAQAPDGGPDLARNEFGMSALYRLYRGSDRWFFLAVDPSGVARLSAVTGHSDGASASSTWRDPDGRFARTLAERFGTETAGHWVSRLRRAGFGAHGVATIDEAAAYLADRGVVYYEPGVEGERVARPGIGSWLSETPPQAGANPGAIGSQAVDILEDLGLTGQQIAALADAGVIRLPDDLPTIELWT